MSSAASATNTAAPAAAAAAPAVVLGKSGKKICCACPETKRVRDTCVVTRGEEHCGQEIELHKVCLREDGFVVK